MVILWKNGVHKPASVQVLPRCAKILHAGRLHLPQTLNVRVSPFSGTISLGRSALYRAVCKGPDHSRPLLPTL
jgi:hypothetical protein